MNEKKEYYRKYRMQNKEKLNEYKRKWRIKNDINDTDIVCPFYLSETALSLRCEGVFQNNDTIHKFKNEKAKKDHRSLFCAKYDYQNCPYAWYLLKLYEK